MFVFYSFPCESLVFSCDGSRIKIVNGCIDRGMYSPEHNCFREFKEDMVYFFLLVVAVFVELIDKSMLWR